MSSQEAAPPEEHSAAILRCGEVEVEASCSCGAWLKVQVDPENLMIMRRTFNRLCPSINLLYKILKGGSKSEQ